MHAVMDRLDDLPKPALVALVVIGFIVFWPVGLALLVYTIWSGRMFCGRHGRHGRRYTPEDRDAAREARLETARVWTSSARSCWGVSVTASSAAWPAGVLTPSCAPAPGAPSAAAAADATSMTPSRDKPASRSADFALTVSGRTRSNYWPKVEDRPTEVRLA